MDGRRERFLATLIGALGSSICVVAFQVLPQKAKEHLIFRWPQMIFFFGMLLLVGGLGGYLGHRAFVKLFTGRARSTGLLVGALAGLAIGVTTWALTYLVFGGLFPFHPVDGSRQALVGRSLPVALLAGPLVGAGVGLAITSRLNE